MNLLTVINKYQIVNRPYIYKIVYNQLSQLVTLSFFGTFDNNKISQSEL